MKATPASLSARLAFSLLLLAAVVLQQIQRGESGGRIMEQIVQLAGQIEEYLPEATR